MIPTAELNHWPDNNPIAEFTAGMAKMNHWLSNDSKAKPNH